MTIRGEIRAADMRDVIEHPAYALLVERMLARRKGLSRELETADEWEKVARAQAAILELDMILALPASIIAELGKRSK